MWLPRGWGDRGGMDWELGIGRCKLFYREWINHKVLLYGTETYTQYLVINRNGKEYEKRVYIYVKLIALHRCRIMFMFYY